MFNFMRLPPLRRLMLMKAITGGGSWSTISGNPVSFTAKAAPLRQLKVAFSPVQDLHGYDSPWPAGGGKNLVNVPDNSGTVTSYYFRDIALGFAPIAGVEYTISLDVTSTVTPFNFTIGVGLNSYAADIKTTVGWENGRVYATFTPTATQLEDRPNLFVRCPRYGTQQTFDWTIKNVQLELGSTPTAYAPYTNLCPISGWDSLSVYHSGADTSNPQTISISLGQTVYSGYVDVISGVVTVDTLYKALTGAETVSRQSQSGGAYYRFNITGVISDNPAPSTVVFPKFCSHFKPISYTQLSNQDNSIARFQNDTAAYIRCDTYTSAADFKAFLAEQYAAGTPVQIGSPIATPIPIQLTPQQVQSLAGDNVVWSTANGDLTVEYRSN